METGRNMGNEVRLSTLKPMIMAFKYSKWEPLERSVEGTHMQASRECNSGVGLIQRRLREWFSGEVIFKTKQEG